MQGWWEIREGARQAINRLLARLMADGALDGLLVPLRTPDERNVVPTLIRDPALLERADPLAPVLPRNAGTVLGHITATGPEGRLGAVLRNCELRTAVELAKVQQVDLDEVMFVVLDCPGTYDVETYASIVDQGRDPVGPMLAQARRGPTAASPDRPRPRDEEGGDALRAACSMCEHPIPAVSDAEYAPDVAIGFLGVPDDKRLWVSVWDDALGEVMGLEPAPAPPTRGEAVAALLEARTAERDRRLAALRERVHGPDSVLAEFATCIGCQNCMVVCPICYCRECIFRTDVFHHTSASYWDWAERKGAVRLPSDTLLFHLTRMLHMAHACVGCGACSDACPVGIPVADIFRAVGAKVQARFDYLPGRDPEEEMVIATFREDELDVLGS